jgi:radical SAM/Cys-rich protein
LNVLQSEPNGYSFPGALLTHGLWPLRRDVVTTLQVNVGKLCNQACHHCHVEAGPKRTESMSEEVAERVLTLLSASPAIGTIDITGGAPELNPNFRRLIIRSRELGRAVIDRCNLTVLLEPGMESLADFLATHQVEITASLPCYTEGNVDAQRGRGVFDKSIRALQHLNKLGYGMPGSALKLNLVYNPLGASLPPDQGRLETDYKRQLREHFSIEFDRLFTLTNMPIKRFADCLHRSGKRTEYMNLLVAHFNPAIVSGLMCRSLVSVGWDGVLYDCDFNQMLEIGVDGHRLTVWDVESFSRFSGQRIATASHCFGCTAGAGSSCGGALRKSARAEDGSVVRRPYSGRNDLPE